jgi:hypothetical protein
MKILQAKCKSWEYGCLALLALFGVAQLLSLGAYAIHEPSLLVTSIPGSLIFGWFLLPLSLLHNLTGYTGEGESVPRWAAYYISTYWLVVLILIVGFLWKKKWFIFSLLAIVFLCSAKGCYHMAMTME